MQRYAWVENKEGKWEKARGRTVRSLVTEFLTQEADLTASQISNKIRELRDDGTMRPTYGTVSGTLHKMMRNNEVVISDMEGGPRGGHTWRLIRRDG